MGVRVCRISCITNMASGISKTPLSHVEVQETADRVSCDFKRLVTASIVQIFVFYGANDGQLEYGGVRWRRIIQKSKSNAFSKNGVS